MLNSREIKSLAKKLCWDIETTKYCLDDLFSKHSSVIDNQIIFTEDVCEYLRFCTASKNYKQRKRDINKSFLIRFLERDPIKTISYFVRDIFFSGLLVYLSQIESTGKKAQFRHPDLRLDNYKSSDLDKFYWAMTMADDSEDGSDMDYWMVQIEIGVIIDKLIWEYQFQDVTVKPLVLGAHEEYVIKLATKVIREVGFQIFLSNEVRDAFVNMESTGSRDLLREATREMLNYGKDINTEYIFIYCLCESLKIQGYKAENTYGLISELQGNKGMSESSVRRRYYDVKKDIKKKSEDLNNIINKYKFGRRIDASIRKIVSNKDPS